MKKVEIEKKVRSIRVNSSPIIYIKNSSPRSTEQLAPPVDLSLEQTSDHYCTIERNGHFNNTFHDLSNFDVI